MSDILGKKITVKQIRSFARLTKIQKANLLGLGLKRIGSVSEFLCSKETFGMIKKVRHLVEIKLIK